MKHLPYPPYPSLPYPSLHGFAFWDFFVNVERFIMLRHNFNLWIVPRTMENINLISGETLIPGGKGKGSCSQTQCKYNVIVPMKHKKNLF